MISNVRPIAAIRPSAGPIKQSVVLAGREQEPLLWGLSLLSHREREVLALASDGLLDKEICVLIGVSQNTLRTYWKRIRSKVGPFSRTALVAQNVRASHSVVEVCDIDAVSSEAKGSPGANEPRASLGRLPNFPTTFYGRHREIAEISLLLASRRLVTLVGAGGTGKTRLAEKVCRSIEGKWPSGVYFCEFASLSDSAQLLHRIASVFGVQESDGHSLLESIIEHLIDRELLLVVDNCEHVRDASAQLCDSILTACPRVTILATSRERLAVSGESLYHVGPLCVSTCPATVGSEEGRPEAIDLFVDRAMMADSKFELTEANSESVFSICRRLNGLPLAIELAAARIRSLKAKEIDQQLVVSMDVLEGGGPSVHHRHRSLDSLIEWSYGLLSPRAQVLFRRLSTFEGSWTLEAAVFVGASAGESESDVINALTELCDKSLTKFDQRTDRFSFLPTIKQFACSRLQESGEFNIVGSRFVKYYVTLSNRAEKGLEGTEQAFWLDLLDGELTNLNCAIHRSREFPEACANILQFCAGLWLYWSIRKCKQMAKSVFTFVTDQCMESTNAQVKGRALNGAGYCLQRWSELDLSAYYFERALECARKCGDRKAEAVAINGMAINAMCNSSQFEAESFFVQALQINLSIDCQAGAMGCFCNLGNIQALRGAFREAEQLFLLALKISRDLGVRDRESIHLANLGTVATDMGEYVKAAKYFEQSGTVAIAIGNKQGEAASYIGTASSMLLKGATDGVVALLKKALAICQEVEFDTGVAWCYDCLAKFYASEANWAKSVIYFAASQKMQEKLRLHFSVKEVERTAIQINAAREALGTAAFQNAWDQGIQMPRDELSKIPFC